MTGSKIRLGIIWLAILVIIPGSACFAGKPPVVWKSGTIVPKGVGYARQIDEILEPGILKATQGHVCLKTFFGGILGDDEDFIDMVKKGRLEACGLSAQGALMACPDMAALSLPFMFRDYSEVDYIKKQMHSVFEGKLKKNGFKLVLWLDQGFDQIYSVHAPVVNLADFRKARFLSWNGELEKEFFKRINVEPQCVNVPEFNKNIRQGNADAYIGPPIWCVATQLYSVIRYINTTNIRYSPAVLLVSQKEWNKLSEAHRKGIESARMDWQEKFCAGSRSDNAKCIKGLLSYGVSEAVMTPMDISELQKAVLPLRKNMAGRIYSEKTLEMLQNLLKEFRAAK